MGGMVEKRRSSVRAASGRDLPVYWSAAQALWRRVWPLDLEAWRNTTPPTWPQLPAQVTIIGKEEKPTQKQKQALFKQNVVISYFTVTENFLFTLFFFELHIGS